MADNAHPAIWGLRLNKPDEKSSAGNAATGDVKVSNVARLKIIADEANNSVIIVATAQDYEVILRY